MIYEHNNGGGLEMIKEKSTINNQPQTQKPRKIY